MKFSPCTGLCRNDGTHCTGCGRSHDEIKETRVLVTTIVEHLNKYNYDDPEVFLNMLKTKSLKQLTIIKE